jgi:SAM-dependent methyltransferase
MNIDEIELGVLYKAVTPQEVLKQLQEHESRIKFARSINFVSDEEGFILGHKEASKTITNYNQNASSYHSEHAGKLVAQDQLDEFISMVNPPAQVLDIGSGPGYDAGYLAQKYSVTGIELSKRFMQIAQFENPSVNFINADITKYDIGSNRYRGVWARDSIHHIPEAGLDELFKKISGSLVDEGVFYVIVREGAGEIVEKETSNYVTTEKFFHLFSEDELRQHAQKAGFKVVKIERSKRSHNWLIGVFKK